MSDFEASGTATSRTASGEAAGRAAELGDRVRSLRLPIHDDAPSRVAWLPWGLCVLLATTSGWFLYAAYHRPAADEEAASGPAAPETKMPTGAADPSPPAPVSREGIALESKGYIIAAHQILVSPKVNGMLIKLNVVEGMRLKKDDVIAELEKTDYEADRDRAAATLAAAKAGLERAQARVTEAETGFREQEKYQVAADLDEALAQLVQLESEFKRYADLNAKGKAVTDQALEETESKYLGAKHRVVRLENALELMRLGERDERKVMARAELKQAEGTLKQSEAELAKAQWRLDNCTIRAPISGTVLKKNAEENNIVNPIAFNGSFSICDVADLSDLEVDLSIQERDISAVFVGQKCKVRAEAFPKRVYDGLVSRLMPIADRAKAAIPVRVKLSIPADEEGVYLKPEMGATVTFYKSGPTVDAAGGVKQDAH